MPGPADDRTVSVRSGNAADRSLESLLRAALEGPDAPVVRAAVAGAAAALRSAPGGGDPATRAAADLLAALLGAVEPPPLDEGEPPAAAGADPRTPGPVPVGQPDGGLGELVAAFRADPAVASRLGAAPGARDAGDRATWTSLWLAFLRLPDTVAAPWRERAAALYPDDGSTGWVELPGDGAVLVAPAPGLGLPGLRESPGTPPASWITVAAPDAPPAVLVLAGQVDRMIDIDGEVQHALEPRRRTGFHLLADPGNRNDLRTDLGYVLEDLAAARVGSVAALEALRRVDEVLCSVVHVPPADPESWWGRLAARSRAVLLAATADLRARGEDVEVRAVPLGAYAEHRELIGSDVACPAPGRPESEVLACLRVWLRVGNDRRLGRVVRVRNVG